MKRSSKFTRHEKAEADLTAYALSFPETDLVSGWGTTRYLRVCMRGFCVFGAKDEPRDALTITVKLPQSAPLARELPFVRLGSDWYQRHDWVIAHFGPADDVAAEYPTLRFWIRQSYRAVAPKRLARLVEPD